MVAISVSKAKVIEGEKYNKVAVVQLPVYEDICNNPKYAYDIEIKIIASGKKIDSIYSSLESLFPSNN